MKKANLILLLFIAAFTFSCKKDNVVANLGGENNLLSLNVPGQLGTAFIDNITHNVSVIVPSTMNRTNLTANISVSTAAIPSINNSPKSNNITADFSRPVTLNITAPNGNVSTWTITVTTDMEYYGLGGTVSAEKSLAKTFEWYYDQGNTGTYSSINCGPAVATMACKWADSTFNHTVEEARKTYLATGGWWYTNNIVDYLNKYGITPTYTSLPDNYQTIKKFLDKNYIVILCLDNYYMRYNDNMVQHINKYYKINATGSGHFVVVKGYKQIGSTFYFETYDPWSLGITYTLDGTLKGKSRYYLSDDLEQATNVWWDYAIIVPAKGKNVVLSNGDGFKTQSVSSIPVQKGA